MAFTYGTSNIKVFTVNNITLRYYDNNDGFQTIVIQPGNIENGVTVNNGIGNSVNLCNGAEIPRSEKGMVSFILMGTATELTLWKKVLNTDNSVCNLYDSLLIELNDDSTLDITGNPHAEFASKGGEINKLTVSMEVNAKDADDIIVWEGA